MTLRVLIPAFLLVGELVAAAAMVSWQLTRPAPPRPDFSRLPAVTAADLERLRSACWKDTSAAWRELGEAYLAYGYFAEAEPCLRRAVELSPRDYLPNYRLACTLERLGRNSEAIAGFQQTAKLVTPREAQNCAYRAARIAVRMEDHATAETEFQKTLTMPHAQCAYARYLIRTGRAAEAVPWLERLRAEDALEIRTEMLAVQLFDALDRPLEADRAAARADRAADGYRLASHWEELHPIRVRYGALARLGRVEQLVQGQQAPAAAAEFQHLIETLELDTMEPMLVTGAKVALMSAELDQARTYLDLFATRMDDTPLVRHLRGQLEGAAGNLEPAAAQLAAAAATQPSAESYQILTQLLEQLGRHDEAYEANSAALSERAIEAYAGNNLDAALQDFDQAIRRQTVAPRTWYYLGLTLEAKGESQLARQAFQDCLKADPHHGPAIRALSRLAGK